LHDPIGHDPQLVGVQFDESPHAAGQNPLTVMLVDQILLAVTLGQRCGKLGH
jgi:hypothetical protein